VCGDAEFKGSVVDVVCDLTVGCNIFMNDSTSTVGNIYKNGVQFIHNFGAANAFVGKGAGNFTMTGSDNSGFGVNAFASNTTGTTNSAFGRDVLTANIDGDSNSGFGQRALADNTSGDNNVGMGASALELNTSGSGNVAVGRAAVSSNETGLDNTGVGDLALAQAEGNSNIAVGRSAGFMLTSGDDNIYIGSDAGAGVESGQIRIGTSGDQTDCYIQGIFGATFSVGGLMVSVDSDGKLGTMPSSKRFKTNIIDMDTASDGLMDLRPVQFTYKNDAKDSLHYGLIAEEVEQVYPELVVRDKVGETYSVRYYELPVMLLNELQKDRETIKLLQNTIKDLVARIITLEEKTKQ
ncbi:MAG: tail fiber domain-containing protein, partial [Candidatus Babeliales bacterium]